MSGTNRMLIYDGDCGFCRACAAWVSARLPKDVRVVPYQQLDLAELGVGEETAKKAVLWVDDQGVQWAGHAAAGKALAAAGGGWARLGRLLIRPPASWAARPVYALVARNRHRLCGRR